MIARIWHGRTSHADAIAYLDFLRERAIPDYRATPGNVAAFVLQRYAEDATHFVTLSFWESMEVIRAFAGDDVEKARYYPEDEDFLLEFEENVVHYEVGGFDGTLSV
jgi:heme-degrading monooxygenase HmoA